MKSAPLIVCKGFLDQCPPEVQQGLIHLMPQKDQQQFFNLPPIGDLNREHLKWDPLDHLHPSWIAPYLRVLSKNEIPLYLAALSLNQREEIEKILGFENHFPQLTTIARRTIREVLTKQLIQGHELIPYAFLPAHPLNPLLGVEGKKLAQLVRFLGLHDLSFEMKQIIATAILKKIFAALPHKEGKYLHTLLLHREPLVFKRLFLEKWDGSKPHLLKMIEERGLHRLGHALYNADPSFVWYLTRKLEIHQGTSTLRYIEKPTHARAEKILFDQIEKVFAFLNKEVKQ